MEQKIKKLIMGLLVIALVTTVISTASATCNSKTTVMTKPTMETGRKMEFRQIVNWCYDGTKITSKSYSIIGGVTGGSSQISYKGLTSTQVTGGVGSTYYQVIDAGKFYNNKASPTWPLWFYVTINQRVTATGGIGVSTTASTSGWSVRTY